MYKRAAATGMYGYGMGMLTTGEEEGMMDNVVDELSTDLESDRSVFSKASSLRPPQAS